jgi:hypothetical protein
MPANEQRTRDPATGAKGLPSGDPGPDRSPAALKSVADPKGYPVEMTENGILIGPFRDCVWIGGDRNSGIPLRIHTGLPEDGSGRDVARTNGGRAGPESGIIAQGDGICHVWGFGAITLDPRQEP